jgi:hypothetical protein
MDDLEIANSLLVGCIVLITTTNFVFSLWLQSSSSRLSKLEQERKANK